MIFIGGILLIVLVVIGCGHDDPAGPVTPAEQVVYFANQDSPYEFYCYHITSGILDTFYLPYQNTGAWMSMAVSPDGKRMYLTSRTSIAVVELQKRQIIRQIPAPGSSYQWGLALSPDGKYLAVLRDGGSNPGGLWILRAATGEAVFADSLSSFNGAFSSDSRHFYCAGYLDERMPTFGYDVALDDNFRVRKIVRAEGSVVRITPNRAGTLWGMFIHVYNDLWLLQLYNPAADSTLYTQPFFPGGGEMAFSADDKYLIYSQPGALNSEVPAPDYFTIFDVAARQISQQVHLARHDGYPAFVDDLYLTPDGKRLICLPRYGNEFFDYNMETKQLEPMIYLGGQYTKTPTGLTGPGKSSN